MAPTIETERLVLRPHAVSDFDGCAAMWADPRVVEHIGGRPFSPQETWTKLLRYVGHWQLLGFGYWVMSERASGRFVGEIGLADFKRAIEPPLTTPEAGWALASWAHGQGYATEALNRVAAWADEKLKTATVCIINPENAASVRVAEKCGYGEMARISYLGQPTLLFKRACRS